MINRRHFLAVAGAATAAYAVTSESRHSPLLLSSLSAANPMARKMPIIALNTSTVRGQKLSIEEQIAITAKAGYDGIEPWIRDIEMFVDGGGKLEDLRKQIDDAGLKVVSAIGFANWIVDDDEARANGLDQARKDMELVKAIGGSHIAAPPVGAHKSDHKSPPLGKIADRYRALLEVGDEVGVVPQLELWGFSNTLSKLSEVAYVATGAQHPRACVLPDFYHIYKGGNDFAGLSMIEASRMHCFHINDYPGTPSIAEIADKDRVFPGDGVCELPKIIRDLIDRGFQGAFSLELFNPEYWKRDAQEVAIEGLQKCRAVINAAMEL